MSWRNINALVQKEIKDAQRNRWFVLLSITFIGLTIALSLLGLSGLGNFGVAGFGRTTASLLNLVVLIIPLMGLLLGAVSIAGEREHGTLLTLLAQPVTASEIFMGKFIGVLFSLSSSILLGFGLSGFIIAWYGGLEQLDNYLFLVLFTLLLGWISLALGFLLSVFIHRNTTAVGFSIFLWFLFLFISDLGIMGMGMVLQIPPSQLLWISMVNPIQVFKLSVITSVHGNLEVIGAAGRYASDTFGESFVFILIVALVLWFIVPFLTALITFNKKCIQ